MVDHQDAPLDAGHHRAVGDLLLRLIAEVLQASKALVAIQYAEPWKDEVRPGRASRSGASGCDCPA